MILKILNKICFTICIVCIVAGIMLGLALIWGSQDSEIKWKCLNTVFVIFAGSALTFAMSKAFTQKSGSKSHDDA